MNNYRLYKKAIFSTLIAVIWLMTLSAKSLAEDTIKVSLGEWPPIASQSLPNFGIGPHIVTAAYAKVGIKVEYMWAPWARAMKQTEDGQADVSALWAFHDERGEKFSYSSPFLHSNSVVFYRKENPLEWSNYDTFPQDMVVGITRSYSYGQAFDSAAKTGKMNVKIASKDKQNLEKLINKRIDAFPGNDLVMSYILKNEFSQEQRDTLAIHPNAISKNPLHMITGKSNTKGLDLLETFNKGFTLLSESGELDQILSEYK